MNIAYSPAIGENIPSDGHLLSEIIGTPKSQVIINLIVAGYYPMGHYKVATSAKRNVGTILKIV